MAQNPPTRLEFSFGKSRKKMNQPKSTTNDDGAADALGGLTLRGFDDAPVATIAFSDLDDKPKKIIPGFVRAQSEAAGAPRATAQDSRLEDSSAQHQQSAEIDVGKQRDEHMRKGKKSKKIIAGSQDMASESGPSASNAKASTTRKRIVILQRKSKPEEIPNDLSASAATPVHPDVRRDNRGGPKNKLVNLSSSFEGMSPNRRAANGSEGKLYSPKGTPRKPRNFFAPYLNEEQVKVGLAAGTLKQGVFRMNKKNRKMGYTSIENADRDILLFGSKFQNRAMPGDTIVVEILQGEDLKVTYANYLQNRVDFAKQNRDYQNAVELVDGALNVNQITPEEIEQIEADTVQAIQDIPLGRVVYIVKSPIQGTNIVGQLSLEFPGQTYGNNANDRRKIWFKPADKQIPFMAIPREVAPNEFLHNPGSFEGMLVTAMIVKWDHSAQYPLATYTGLLGQIGEIGVESEALLVASQISSEAFSDEIIDALPATVLFN